LVDSSAHLDRWADEQLRQMPMLDEPDDKEVQEEAHRRSLVVLLVLHGADQLQRRLHTSERPYYIILGTQLVTRLLISENPPSELVAHAFSLIGRYPFSPYRTAGGLSAGSPLFVGRRSEIGMILSSLRTQDHVIVGSRRIGKTSLLTQLNHWIRQEITQDVLVLSLRLQEASRDINFYDQVRQQLRNHGLDAYATRLGDSPPAGYTDLRQVMEALCEKYGHPVVFLIDEVDGLHHWDRTQNQERFFQFLRSELAQAEPRTCTFIMTGYRHIDIFRRRYDSVFFNFCKFHNLAGVEPQEAAELIKMLKTLDFKFEQEKDLLGLITRRTYAIPYYVQDVCVKLLQRADRKREAHPIIAPIDVTAVLEGDLQTQLKRELWDELAWGGPEMRSLLAADNQQPEVMVRKTKILLLGIILERYQGYRGLAFQPLPAPQYHFRAHDAIRYLKGFVDLPIAGWQPDESEVDGLLRSLTMTLALSPSEDDQWAYTFTAGILPNLLLASGEQENLNYLVDELEKLVRELKQLLLEG
jgi:hypothetical protein